MNRAEIQGKLDAFVRDSKQAMNRQPTKYDEAGRVIPDPFTAFSAEEIRGNDFVVDKDAVRRKFSMRLGGVLISLDEVRPGRAPIADIDRPENLVDRLQYARPADMDAAGLQRAALDETPWSDDYWPFYLGELGRRYADPNFPTSRDWAQNRRYVQEHPVQEILASGRQQAIDRLSPSEKYDLLVGDPAGALTAAMWEDGRRYYERYGQVETWMGICHGWAPAAYMLSRPRRAVTVKAADGRTDLRFYPSDIKALASLLWANAAPPTRFIGTRTDEKNPETDEVGRMVDPAVFDTNPGTWHMAAVNQIGVARRSFIIDATYDYEVWNQPVFGYEYAYFNPQSMRMVDSLAQATVMRAAFTNDRFRKYRTEGYASAAGVAMRVSYVVETEPRHAPTDDPSRDAVNSVDYIYDLELDARGRILGGEWYTNLHPDFLWTPPPGARARTPADRYATGRWIPPAPMPASWRAAARRVAPSRMPLAKIVERLIELAGA
jgi:hypothetical protein